MVKYLSVTVMPVGPDRPGGHCPLPATQDEHEDECVTDPHASHAISITCAARQGHGQAEAPPPDARSVFAAPQHSTHTIVHRPFQMRHASIMRASHTHLTNLMRTHSTRAPHHPQHEPHTPRQHNTRERERERERELDENHVGDLDAAARGLRCLLASAAYSRAMSGALPPYK